MERKGRGLAVKRWAASVPTSGSVRFSRLEETRFVIGCPLLVPNERVRAFSVTARRNVRCSYHATKESTVPRDRKEIGGRLVEILSVTLIHFLFTFPSRPTCRAFA